MILVALPRRVLPTSRPPFLRRHGNRRCRLRSGLLCLWRAGAAPRRAVFIENTVLIPLRKPAMAGRIGRILVRHLRPLCAGTQNPQHPIENVARVAPRSTAFFARANLFRLGNVRSNDLPLLVGEVHDQPTNTSSDEWKDPCKRWNNIDRLRTARGYGMRSSKYSVKPHPAQSCRVRVT